jgi:hypothetical protein
VILSLWPRSWFEAYYESRNLFILGSGLNKALSRGKDLRGSLLSKKGDSYAKRLFTSIITL